MINGLENMIQTGFFSSSYTNVSLSLLVGGTGCCQSTSSAQSTANTRIPSQKRNKKAWETFKDSRKGNEMKLKGKEGVKEGEGLGEAGKFGRNEERGWKKGKQKAKETQKLNLRDTPRRERAESCAHFLD